MKQTWLSAGILAFTLTIAIAQDKAGDTPSKTVESDQEARFSISERGAHHKTWERIEYEPGLGGKLIPRRHVYQELATGMHYQDEKEQWLESEAKIEILPDNTGAVANKGQHKVIFPPDVYDGQIELNLPDSSWLRSRVLGLSYLDTESGRSVLIAEITNSVGEIHGDNVVLYPNAFTDFQADLRYTYTREGFEQDVVLREKIPLPEEYDLNPKTTRLQVLTEFFNPPAPIKTEQAVAAKSGDVLPDQTLSFGAMQMGAGKAFPLADDSGESIPVGKQWQQIEGRDFLIEEVQVSDVIPFLDKLSKPDGASLDATQKTRRLASLERQLPVKRRVVKQEPKGKKGVFRMASTSQPRDGFVLDYVATLSSSQTNYTFQANGTHYISGNITLYGTNTTFEPNTVIKYATNVTLTVNTPVTWLGDSYRPVYLVSKDDNSVGENVSGSTGSPGTAYYAANALYFNAATANTNLVIQDVRVANATRAISINTKSGHVLKNVQLLNCANGLSLTNAEVSLRNALFYRVMTNFTGSSSTGRVEQLTSDVATRMNQNIGSNLFVTNSVLIAIGDLGTFTGYKNYTNASAAGIFQTVNGGAHYLINGSTNRAVGATSINAAFLAELRAKTTYPPIAYTNQWLTNFVTLSPRPIRDTNNTPDLGYHYDALDYVFGGCDVTNDLTFAAGTAVGWFRTTSGWGMGLGHGLRIGDYKTVNFSGLVTSNCYFAHQLSVQESLVGYTPAAAAPGAITGYAQSLEAQPNLNLTFTKFSIPAPANHIRDGYGNIRVSGNHCEFYNGGVGGYVSTLGMTNCLFYRCSVNLIGGVAEHFTLQNCTLLGAAVYIQRWPEDSGGPGTGWVPVTVVGCAFDGTEFSGIDEHGDDVDWTTYGYNAYLTSADSAHRLPWGSNDVTVASFNWRSNWLGRFYLPSDSALTNKGNAASAGMVGLYHFTTQTNQVKETNSIVDIGYHYVAFNASGQPLDFDGDGIPDYVEDANGNGVVDPGENPWSVVITNHPQSWTVSPGDSVTFTVGATGTPLYYQWLFNGTNAIAGATSSSLVLNPVAATNAGVYSVIVSNANGQLVSSNATLTVTCLSQPSGLMAWWQAESSTYDSISNNHGYLFTGGYTNGYQNKAFRFSSAVANYAIIPDAPALRPASLTLEAWVYPMTSASGYRTVLIKGQAVDSHSFALYSQSDDDYPTVEVNFGGNSYGIAKGTNKLSLNKWSHLVGTYDRTNLLLYVNGAESGRDPNTEAVSYAGGPVFIGGNTIFPGGESFNGHIDEVAIYNRALSATEVRNLHLAGDIGKCPPTPRIIPGKINTFIGNTATFTVVGSGVAPVSYQWRYNGTNIVGATNATLNFTNLQLTNAGNYSVVLSNSQGVTTTSEALLVSSCYPAVDVALVVDKSGSMTSDAGSSLTRIAAARVACTNFVQSLNYTNDQVGILTFSDNATIDQTLTNDRPSLLHRVGQIATDNGETYMGKALMAAQAELSSQRHHSTALPVLVFLTDGEPDDSSDAILSIATQIKNAGTRLITVGLGSDLGTNHIAFLKSLATTTNDFYQATNTIQLTNVYSLIANSICRGTNQPPEVAWVSPTNSQLFITSPTNIVLQATNTAGSIDSIVYYNGADEYLGGATNPPYQFLWQNVPSGTNILKAVGVDSTDGSFSAAAIITIVVNAMPTVAITSPTNRQQYWEVTNVTITATAADGDGSITNVAFYNGTNFLGNDTSAPYSIVWNGRTNDFYAITAVATDNQGASKSSLLKVFEVVSTNTAPVVWITYPTNNEVFRAGAEITITANVVPGSGTVTNVEFFVDGRFFGGDLSSPYSITECCWKSGTYALVAKAMDNLGAWSVSTQVNIIVLEEPLTAQGYWDPQFGLLAATNMQTLFWSNMVWRYGNAVAVSSDGQLLCMKSGKYFTGTNWSDSAYPLSALSYYGTNGSVSFMHAISAPDYLDASSLGFWSAVKVDGTNIYVGGRNLKGEPDVYNDGYPVLNVLKWSGGNWQAVCTNNSFSKTNAEIPLALPTITAIEVIGGDLYVAGTFLGVTNTAGLEDTNVQYVAKLDSANAKWISVATNHLNGPVLALCAMNGQLYAGGMFSAAGGNTNAHCIARLDGNKWMNLEMGVAGPSNSVPFVTSLSACGSDLYVGGRFSTASGDTNALGLAIWNGSAWKTLGGPSSSGYSKRWYGGSGDINYGSLDPWQDIVDTNLLPVVFAVKAHGKRVFVGGIFSSIIHGNKEIPALNIAQAVWSEGDQNWTWSDLGGGTVGFCGPDAAVRALAIREGSSIGTYDLLVGGNFDWVGPAYMRSPSFALWRVGPLPPQPPAVLITNPVSGTIFTNPESIQITARITSNYTNINTSSIRFWENGNLITSTAPYEDPAGSGSYHIIWNNPDCGFHTFTASAMDEASLLGQSEPVFIYVAGSNCVNTITPGSDYFNILQNELATLHVLTNDSTTTGNPLQIVNAFQAGNVNGTVEVNWDRKSIIYRPNKDTYGDDHFMYVVTDGISTNLAAVTVKIRARPNIFIQTPAEDDKIGATTNIVVHGVALDYDSTITNIAIFVNGSLIGQVSPPNSNYVANPTNFTFTWNPGGVSPQTSYAFFTFNWSTSVAGYYTFAARAIDSHGYTNLFTLGSYPILNSHTPPVTIAVTNNTPGVNVPVAQILSFNENQIGQLSITEAIVLRDGILTNLIGDAYDLDAGDTVAYRLSLVEPNDPEGEALFNVTPRPLNHQGYRTGAVTNNLLGEVDLTGVENGSYLLRLEVRSGGEESIDTVPITVASKLKIGPFSFSEQDLVIPVSGIPLTIMRTYNSFNARSSDFGYGWSFALNSMDVQLNETREFYTVGGKDERSLSADDEETDDGLPRNVSIRTGGSYDVTLTLPGGERTTFAFAPEMGNFYGTAKWEAPPGVTATLRAYPSLEERIDYFPYLYWAAEGRTVGIPDIYAHDVKGWVLETQDGTKYYITRGEANNVVWDSTGDGDWVNVRTFDAQPKLTRIEQRSGDVIVIGTSEIKHYANGANLTRAIVFGRDGLGRISAVWDPNSGGTNGHPSVKYLYDTDAGNLVQVHRLLDRNAGTYAVTKYRYDHPDFPHHITAIEDSRGISVARNLYDEWGKLVGIIDAAGKTNRFEHDLATRREVHYDRSGQPTVYGYDLKGNITHTIDALSHTNQFLYDENDHLTNSVNALGHVTSFVNDANGNPLSATLPYPVGANAENYTTHLTYNQFGDQTSVRLPSGGVITNEFNPDTGLLLAVKDGSGNLISATVYNELNLPKTETDTFGSLHYVYDAMGNLAFMTNSLGQMTESGYDLNGNLTTLSENGQSSTIAYDAMNRETGADYGNGITVNYEHDGEGDWSTVEGPTLGHMERKMDEQGRLAGWETANGSTPGFAYDVNGRLEYETNSIGVVTRTAYNAVGWVTATTNLTTGSWVAHDYDAGGHRTVTTNAFGFTTRYDYYPSGSLKAMTNAFGTNVWLYTDAAGACSSCGSAGTVTDPLNRTVEAMQTPYGLPVSTVWRSGSLVSSNFIEYLVGMTTEEQEAEEYPVAITDEGNRTRRYDYDDLGRLYRATDLSGATWWTNHFDAESGALTNVLSPTGETLGYTYDNLDNVKSIRFGDGNSLTNFYNEENRLSGVRLPSGVAVTNFYDSAGRLTNSSSTIGETVTLEYNGNDAVVKTTDPTGGTTNLYDAAGRLWGIDYPSGASVRYQLDVLDRIIGITNKATAIGTAYVTQYQYDPIGNVTNVIDPFNGATKFEYDRVGRKTKRTLPNLVVTTYDYNWRDQVTNIVHKNSGGTTLASVLYERLPGGEPSKITREDGTFVELKYDPALRLTNEVYKTSGGSLVEEISYGYDASGSRARLVKGGQTLTNSVNGGYRITAVNNAANGSTVQSYGYDNGGRVTTITRDSTTLNLSYNSADQVHAVTNGAAWVTYTHDAGGRRTFSTNNASVVRKFLVASTPGTDLESPQLIANASDGVQQGYVYLGDDPILRYGTGGAASYYLEDGMGSVIGLAPASGPSTVNTTRIFYDGFGNTRTTAGPAPTIPTGTGGDFRFHGAWLEEQSGLYHMRAREYDARMGRFTSRDPNPGGFKIPETLVSYTFACANPFIYSDPSGEFSVIEINVSGSLSSGMQGLRSAVIQEAKNRGIDKLVGGLEDVLWDQLKHLMPLDLSKFKVHAGFGQEFENRARAFICAGFKKIGMEDEFHYNVRIHNSGRKSGNPFTPGKHCVNKENPGIPGMQPLSWAVPDFIISSKPPYGVRGGMPSAWLVGDFKATAGTFYNSYVVGTKRDQFTGIIDYAKKHTSSRTAVFVVGWNNIGSHKRNQSPEWKQIRRLMGKQLTSRGVLGLMVAIID
jgi:RHS repeat-associated protein